MRSDLLLRTRLTLGYTLIFALMLAVLSTGVYYGVRQVIYRVVADRLQQGAAIISADFAASGKPLQDYVQDASFVVRDRPALFGSISDITLFVQICTPDGAVAARSASLRDISLPINTSQLIAALNGQESLLLDQFANNDPAQFIMLITPLKQNNNTIGVLQVALIRNKLDIALQLLSTSLILFSLIALVAAAAAGAWLAQRALAPVVNVARSAQRIIVDNDLTQRVARPQRNDEIGELATTINAMLGRIEQLLSGQRRFVADVSHELRTPLAAMLGLLHVLRRNAPPAPHLLDETLAGLEREAQRLNRLTNDLLLLAHQQANLPLRLAQVALDELVLEVVRDMQPLTNGVTLSAQIASQIAVSGDRDRLKQALVNLVANALQHTQHGGVVLVSLLNDATHAQLSVRDTGSGIKPEDIPHIFERFYRADQSRSRMTGGTGLGLSIVKWIAEAHGGRVAVQSVVGQGSTFVITLPLHSNSSNAPAEP